MIRCIISLTLFVHTKIVTNRSNRQIYTKFSDYNRQIRYQFSDYTVSAIDDNQLISPMQARKKTERENVWEN